MERVLDMATLMTRLRRMPIFPLPGAVLIPGGQLPLHVFEPRYRALVNDCLADDGLMAIGMLAERRTAEQLPPIHPVTTLGLINHHVVLDDGRLLILVQGLLRAQIVKELHSDEPYRLVRAIPMRDDLPPDLEDLAVSARLLRRLVVDLARRLPDRVGNPLASACLEEAQPGRLADIVGAAILTDPLQRQSFLEQRDVARRLEMMTSALAAVLSRMSPAAMSN